MLEFAAKEKLKHILLFLLYGIKIGGQFLKIKSIIINILKYCKLFSFKYLILFLKILI